MQKVRKGDTELTVIFIKKRIIIQNIKIFRKYSILFDDEKYINESSSKECFGSISPVKDIITNLEDFDFLLNQKKSKVGIYHDFNSKIVISKLIETRYGVYYFQRAFKNIKSINTDEIKKYIKDFKRTDFFNVGKIKGKCVLSPNILVVLIERLVFSLSDLFLIDNVTFSCIDQNLFNNKISLYDIPLLRGGFVHRHYDDDFIPTKKKIIIKNGKVKNYLSGVNIGSEKNGNVYYDEIQNESRMSFSNLYLKVPKKQKKMSDNFYLEDTLTPLKIDLFTGNIEGLVFGIEIKTGKKIIGEFQTNYISLFNSMNRVGKYFIYQGHKISKNTVIIGE